MKVLTWSDTRVNCYDEDPTKKLSPMGTPLSLLARRTLVNKKERTYRIDHTKLKPLIY